MPPCQVSATAATNLKPGRHRPGPRQKNRCHRRRAEASEGCGLSVSVRKGELENVERNRDKSLGVTVYVGNRRATPAPLTFRKRPLSARCKPPTTLPASPPKTRWPACPTKPTLPTTTPIWICSTPGHHQRRSRRHCPLRSEQPCLDTERASPTAKARRCRPSKAIFSAPTRTAFAAATPARATAFRWRPLRWQRRRRHAARRLVQLDARASELASPEAVGRYAAERALSRLQPQNRHHQCPVLFESPLAAGLLGGFVHAMSGGALYRKSSFLLDSLGKRVFPKHIHITKTRIVMRGKGSSPFDEEGVITRARKWSSDGGWRATSSAPIRPANWACAPPATRAVRTTW
jgi:PmbA protein